MSVDLERLPGTYRERVPRKPLDFGSKHRCFGFCERNVMECTFGFRISDRDGPIAPRKPSSERLKPGSLSSGS